MHEPLSQDLRSQIASEQLRPRSREDGIDRGGGHFTEGRFQLAIIDERMSLGELVPVGRLYTKTRFALSCLAGEPKELVRSRVEGDEEQMKEHRPARLVHPLRARLDGPLPDLPGNAFDQHVPQGAGRLGPGVARGREAVELENPANAIEG